MHRQRLYPLLTLIGVLVGVGGGCAGQSTAPIDRDGPISVSIVDSNRVLAAQSSLIDSLTKATIARVTAVLPLRGVRSTRC